MRARLRDSVCLLIATALALAATAARAGELLVMPYTCSVVGGEVVLNPSRDEGHRIVSPRENREFTACSPADPSMCRKWTIHSFDIDCGGERVPWTSVVAAADQERLAWIESGRLQIRMPPWWTAGGPVGTAAEVIQMPYGFAPKFGIDAIFVAGDAQRVAEGGLGVEPQVGGYESRMAPGAPPPGPASDLAPPKDSEFAVAPGSALPPLGAAEPGTSNRPSARQSRDIPFEIKPPEEGLTVERAPAPDESEPRPEHTFTSVEPEPEPEVTWSEPPPLPQRLDPALRREMADGLGPHDPAASETAMAQAAAPAAQAEFSADSGTPAAPAIINGPTGAGGSSAQGSENTSPVSAEAASDQAPAPGQQPDGEASSAGTDATADAASTTSPAPVVVRAGETPEAAAGAPQQLPAFSNEANAPDRSNPQGLFARVLSGEPAAVAVAVIAGGLLAILILGLSLTRRRQTDLPDLASRDISSVSLEKGSDRAQPSPGSMMHDLGAPTLDPPAARAPAMDTPSLSVSVDDISSRRRTPALAATQARRDPPGASWGEAIPRTHAEALRVLGMGVTREASPASIKKVVDGLRMSWHPDYAENEADRTVRELRMKQINAAWDIISGTRAQQPEPQPARHPEKLHQL